MNKDLFYCPKTRVLCWVAGYTADGNTDVVSEIISSLARTAEKFAGIAGCDVGKVHTKFIESSRRYKNMRVFYAYMPEEYTAAETTYTLENYTIWEWLHD
jgi:hypothetical protein